MGQLLYFVEGVEAVSPQLLEQCGLGHAFENGCAQRRASNGPGEQNGVVCGADSEQIGFFPQMQTWKRLPGRPNDRTVWIGWNASEKQPGPEQLARREQLPGHLLELADGNKWTVPIAQRWDGGGFRRALGARMKLDDTGNWVEGDVVAKYAELWRVAMEWQSFRERSIDGEDVNLTLAAAADMCAIALGVNYRVSRLEIGSLQLLDDRETYVAILDAVVDLPTWLEFVRSQKKTEAEQAA